MLWIKIPWGFIGLMDKYMTKQYGNQKYKQINKKEKQILTSFVNVGDYLLPCNSVGSQLVPVTGIYVIPYEEFMQESRIGHLGSSSWASVACPAVKEFSGQTGIIHSH